MRSQLIEFSNLQEDVLKRYDGVRGSSGWRDSSAQVLASRLIEEAGEVLDELLGKDQVRSFLIRSLMDSIQNSLTNSRLSKDKLKTELADVANFCMMLHDIVVSRKKL